MAPKIRDPHDLGGELRRIAIRLLDDARYRLREPDAEAIHESRKRCKEIRALARLVRPADDELGKASNDILRDAARELSGARDAEARLETFEALAASEVELLSAVALHELREPLRDAAQTAERRLADDVAAVEHARARLDTAADRIGSWPNELSSRDVLAGLGRNYRRARARFRECRDGGTVEQLHEWRKRVKYGWYQTRYLQNAARSMLRPLQRHLHDLADALGDDHDLALLVTWLRAREGLDPDHVDRFARVAEGRRMDLQRRAIRLGARLYAEPAKLHSDRVGRYLKAWRRYGREMRAGDIEDVAAVGG